LQNAEKCFLADITKFSKNTGPCHWTRIYQQSIYHVEIGFRDRICLHPVHDIICLSHCLFTVVSHVLDETEKSGVANELFTMVCSSKKMFE